MNLSLPPYAFLSCRVRSNQMYLFKLQQRINHIYPGQVYLFFFHYYLICKELYTACINKGVCVGWGWVFIFIYRYFSVETSFCTPRDKSYEQERGPVHINNNNKKTRLHTDYPLGRRSCLLRKKNSQFIYLFVCIYHRL